MDDFDNQLKHALAADPIDERGYYRDALASFRGPGSGLRRLALVGTLVFSALLLLFLFKMMTAPSVDQMVVFGVWTVLCSQAQIALKLWFNMQLNRRALSRALADIRARL